MCLCFFRVCIDMRFGLCYNVKANTGVSPSGKAKDFDSFIRKFESCYPCQAKALTLAVGAFALRVAVRTYSEARKSWLITRRIAEDSWAFAHEQATATEFLRKTRSPFVSCYPCQKNDKFRQKFVVFLSKPQGWYVITRQRVWHRQRRMELPKVHFSAARFHAIALQSIPYRNKLRIPYTALP